MTNRCQLALATIFIALTINDGKTVAAQIDFIQGDFEENLFVQGQFRGEDQNGDRRLELAELKSFSVTLTSSQPSTVLYAGELADLSSFAFSYATSDNNDEETLQFEINSTDFEIDLDASTVAGSSTVNLGENRHTLEGPLGLSVETEPPAQGVPEIKGIVGLSSFGIGLLGSRLAFGIQP